MSKKGETDRRRTVAYAALATGLVAAALVLIMCALLTATYLQLKKADPLNNETLVAMRERYADGERSSQMKTDIRQLDLLSRRAFFTSRQQILSGGLIAVIAGVVMALAFGVYRSAVARVEPPGDENCDGIFWTGIARSRVWIAGGTVVLVALSVVMSVSTPTELTDDLLADTEAPQPVDDGGPVVDTAPVFPEGVSVNAPVVRGAEGSGRTAFAGVPTSWDEETGENVLWKKTIELPGWGGPVVWGDRVIVPGANPESRKVFCLHAETGEEIWTTEVPLHEDIVDEFKADTQSDRWDHLMYAGASPAVNGSQVFAMFSSGQLAALDLGTGSILWNIFLGDTGSNKYGLDSAILIYRNSIIVVFQGDERFIARYDALTGKQIWKTERKYDTWASAILASLDEGKYLLVLPSDPNVTAWDPETGREVWDTEVFTGDIEYCVGPSAVQVGGRVFVNMKNCGIYGLDLQDGSVAWGIEELPDGSSFSDGPSMIAHGKYIYQMFESVLTCIDAQSGQVVSQKEIEEFGNYASPAINGEDLYIPSEKITTVVKADPGSGFADVGRGKISESSDSILAIVEGRIYMRSDQSLYCIGAQKQK